MTFERLWNGAVAAAPFVGAAATAASVSTTSGIEQIQSALFFGFATVIVTLFTLVRTWINRHAKLTLAQTDAQIQAIQNESREKSAQLEAQVANATTITTVVKALTDVATSQRDAVMLVADELRTNNRAITGNSESMGELAEEIRDLVALTTVQHDVIVTKMDALAQRMDRVLADKKSGTGPLSSVVLNGS